MVYDAIISFYDVNIERAVRRGYGVPEAIAYKEDWQRRFRQMLDECFGGSGERVWKVKRGKEK